MTTSSMESQGLSGMIHMHDDNLDDHDHDEDDDENVDDVHDHAYEWTESLSLRRAVWGPNYYKSYQLQ